MSDAYPVGFEPAAPSTDPGIPLKRQAVGSNRGDIMGSVPGDTQTGSLYPPGFTPAPAPGMDDIKKAISVQGNPWGAEGFKQWVEGQKEFDLPQVAQYVIQQRSAIGPGSRTAPLERAHERDEPGPDVGAGSPWGRVFQTIMMAPNDPEAQISAIRKEFPGSQFTQDRYGNAIARIGGQRFYLNPSGLTATDIHSAYEQGLLFGPMVRGAAGAGKWALGNVGRVLGTGLGFSAADTAAQVGAHTVGSSEAPPRLGDITSAGVMGAGMELGAGILGGAVNKVVQLARSPRYMDPVKGIWTTEGREVLQKAGVDPDLLTPQAALAFGRQARQTTDPEAAARIALSRSLPVPVNLTTGQARQNWGDLTRESEAKKGIMGEEAERFGQGVQAAQTEALRGNVGTIQGQISGGAPQVATPGQGVQQAQRALVGQRKAAWSDVDQAYDEARKATRSPPYPTASNVDYPAGGGDVTPPTPTPAGGASYQPTPAYPASAVRNLQNNLNTQLSTYDKVNYPAAHAAIEDLPGQGTRPATVEELENWRARRVNDSTAKPAERGAISKLIQTYDAELEQSLKSDLMSGDPAAIEKWQNARGVRRRFGQIFGEDDAVNELTATMNDGSRRLVVDPSDAANYLFGRGSLGAKTGLVRDINKLKTTLGEDSPEWHAIREDAFLRLFHDQNPNGPFSGAKFNTNLRTAFKSPEVMDSLFTAEEQRTFRQLGQVASWATELPPIGQNVNPPNTAATLTRMMSRLGNIGNLAAFYGNKFIFGPMEARSANAAIRKSFTGALPPRSGPGPTSYAAPAVGTASSPPRLEDYLKVLP